MENIENFNYQVGYIFAELQRTFPKRTSIDILKMLNAESFEETMQKGRPTGKYMREGSVVELDEEITIAKDTIRWLLDTGYLLGVSEAGSGGYYNSLTLSPKALEVLRIAPSSTRAPGKSIGDELEDAFKSEAKSKLAGLASEGLSMLFRFGMGAFG